MKVTTINIKLADVVKSFSPFSFTVGDLGAFPNLNRPNIIWTGVQDINHKLVELHKAVNQGMAQAGFPVEKRKYTPHLTIGRINRKTPRDNRILIGSEVGRANVGILGTVDATEIILYRSILKHTGAEHIPLKEFYFRGDLSK
jgi:2'-5' RNA ligase